MNYNMMLQLKYNPTTGNGWRYQSRDGMWYCFEEDEEIAGPCELAPWEEEAAWL